MIVAGLISGDERTRNLKWIYTAGQVVEKQTKNHNVALHAQEECPLIIYHV